MFKDYLSQEKIEQWQIRRLEKAAAKPKKQFYLYYLLTIVSIVYIVDEVSSLIGSQMQSVVAG